MNLHGCEYHKSHKSQVDALQGDATCRFDDDSDDNAKNINNSLKEIKSIPLTRRGGP
jgi:hypothetical protein